MRMRTNSRHTLLVKRRHLHWYCCSVTDKRHVWPKCDSSKVRKWVRAFKGGREKVNVEPRSGRPSVITDDLVNAVDEKIRKGRLFTISTLALEFPNVGRTTLHTEKLKFRKLCARWVPRLLTEEHKLKRMACALDFGSIS
ncbi:uncharacterized protein TNCV_770961 [Trichonephila clavipes]|nr:uncharacterized protein TNCV_770961 [Trichonephila clavipes]